MFKRRARPVDQSAFPVLVERTVRCTTDLPIDVVWTMVCDPSLPMVGDDEFRAGGWVPGHAPGPGAVRYALMKGELTPLAGAFTQVTAWEPPRRLVTRQLIDLDTVTNDVEWDLHQLPQGVTVSVTMRLQVWKRITEASMTKLVAAIDADREHLAERLPLSLSHYGNAPSSS